MATIDSNIALGVKPLQVENPMNQYAAMSQIQNAQNQNIAAQNQNALAQYQLSSAKRGDEKVNFLNQSFAKNTDPTTGKINYAGVYSDAAQGGFGSEIPALVKQKQAEDAANVKLKTDTSDLIGKKLLNATKLYGDIDPKNPNAVAQYMSIHDSIHNDEDLGSYLKSLGVNRATAKKSIEDSLKVPGGFERLLMQSQLGAKDTYINYENKRHNLETEGTAKGNLAVNQGQLNLSNQKFKFETNPEAQANIAGAKKRAELAVTEEVSRVKDIEGARKVLKTIGFDPISGEDKVRNLIKESTGSYGGASVDFLGRVIGESTKGADAIGQLKTFETKIATDLLGGKLGAGISNSDREFIMAGLGQISDNTIPRDTREKAWSQVVDRMRSVGLMDAPSDATPTPTSSPKPNKSGGIAPPSGFVVDKNK
jgi:hypothetical protein